MDDSADLGAELIAEQTLDEISRSGSSGRSLCFVAVRSVYVKQAHNLALRVTSHGVQLYILSAAYLHSRLYIGPVFHPCTFRCYSQIPILGHRTLIQSCRARPSRVATCSSICTYKRESYTYRIRVDRVVECSSSPGMQTLSTRFRASVCQLCICYIRLRTFIAPS